RLAADHLPPLRPDLPARGRTGAAHTGRLPHLREPEIRPQQGPGLRGDLGRRGRTAGGVRRQPLPDRAPRTDRAAGRLRSARGHRGGDAPRGRSLHGQHRRGPRPGGAPPARGGAPGGRRRGHRRSCHPDRDPAPDQLGGDPAAHRLLTRPHLESDGSTMRRRTMTTALTAALTTSVAAPALADDAGGPDASGDPRRPGGPPGPEDRPPQLLFDGTRLYPRVVRLAHNAEANVRLLASVVCIYGRSVFVSIWEATDDGATLSQISTALDEATATGEGLYCDTLSELPRAMADLPEGSLLRSASVGQEEGEYRRV